MITHPSDFWPVRRWAIYMLHGGRIVAEPFESEQSRAAFVAANPERRHAVGKRHPVVKALRQRWAALTKESREP